MNVREPEKYTIDDLPELRRRLLEVRSALVAHNESRKDSERSSHAMRMNGDMLEIEYHRLRAMVEALESAAPFVSGRVMPSADSACATDVLPVTKYRPTRRLGDAFPDRGVIYKAAESRCVCASTHHRTCTYCGECAVLCGHRPV